MRRREFNAALAIGLASPQVCTAQDRPITIIVPTSTSTSSDIVARLMQPHLVTRLQRPVVVENRVGGSGIIGLQAVARAEPDGSTILIGPNTLLLISALHKSLPFDTKTDFTPVTPLAASTMAAIASTQSGFRNLADFVAAAKRDPGKLNYGSPGVGTAQHLLMEVFREQYKIDVTHVPYKGTAPMVVDLAGGRLDMVFMPLHTSVDLAKRGMVRVVAVNAGKRSPLFPDVPTVKEQGFVMEMLSWSCGFFLPGGAAPAIVHGYRRAVAEVMEMPQIATTLAGSGLTPIWYAGSEFAAEVPRDIDKWKRFAARAGVKPQ